MSNYYWDTNTSASDYVMIIVIVSLILVFVLAIFKILNYLRWKLLCHDVEAVRIYSETLAEQCEVLQKQMENVSIQLEINNMYLKALVGTGTITIKNEEKVMKNETEASEKGTEMVKNGTVTETVQTETEKNQK